MPEHFVGRYALSALGAVRPGQSWKGTNATGPSHAKRVIANADWAATWNITPNFRLVDSFTYDRFQIPGSWDFSTISLYAQGPLINGGPSLLLSPGRFDATNCPPPYTANTCPQHNDNSGPDLTNGTWIRYLGQNFKSNTLQFEYDLSSKFGARLGYRYGNRKYSVRIRKCWQAKFSFREEWERRAAIVLIPRVARCKRTDRSCFPDLSAMIRTSKMQTLPVIRCWPAFGPDPAAICD